MLRPLAAGAGAAQAELAGLDPAARGVQGQSPGPLQAAARCWAGSGLPLLVPLLGGCLQGGSLAGPVLGGCSPAWPLTQPSLQSVGKAPVACSPGPHGLPTPARNSQASARQQTGCSGPGFIALQFWVVARWGLATSSLPRSKIFPTPRDRGDEKQPLFGKEKLRSRGALVGLQDLAPQSQELVMLPPNPTHPHRGEADPGAAWSQNPGGEMPADNIRDVSRRCRFSGLALRILRQPLT